MSKTQQKINFLILSTLFVWLLTPSLAKATDYALSFDGIDDYIEIPDSEELRPTEAISIEAWFNVSTYSPSYQSIYVKGVNPGFIYLQTFHHPDYPGEIWAWSTGLDELGYDNAELFEIGEWHHSCMTYDRVNFRVYVDGDLIDSNLDSDPLVIDSSSTTIGSWVGGIGEFFNGLIDEVRVYNRALSETEVSEHYDGVFNDETGLVGLWHFNEGQGNTTYDSSDQQNNGNISGATWVAGRNYVAPPTPPPIQLSGPFSYRPQIEIESPKVGDRFSEIVEIKYKATDKNDITGSPQLGLGNDAVSLFYSDDGEENWIPIAEKLPPIGTYQWNVGDLSEGDFYQLRALVEDKIEERAQLILDSLIIDRTFPLFDVSVEPPFSRGENVTIKIQATEPLLEAPKVSVRQRDYMDIEVEASGEGAFWEAEYEVRSGIDGTAKISLEGRDLAGNTSNIIRAGGIFHIGINPPPTPIVTSPLDNDIVDTPFISIAGNIREDTKAVLMLNNERVREVNPDPEGNFIIEDVELSKTFYKGFNILQIISEDEGENLSEPVTLSVKFNVAPTIEIIKPQPDDVLFATTSIDILAIDENEDNLTLSIEASSNEGQDWHELVRNLKKQVFIWDTRDFPDGEYILRITVNDGYKEVVLTSKKLRLLNFLPVISFEKERIIINQNSTDIMGEAKLLLEGYKGHKKDIIKVEYSINGGENWILAQPKDGEFNAIVEEFIIPFTNLEEGLYEILVKATDSKDFLGRAKITLITDFGPPPEPTVNFPKIREVFGDKEDINIESAGVQIRIEGLAEADNKIIVENGPLTSEGLSDKEGNFDMEVTMREHGENILKISAIDPAGNKSEKETTLVLIKNNPPDLKFLWPRSNGGLNHIAEIVFEIQDRDLDPIKESILSYRRTGEESKIILAKNLKGNTLSWDVTNLHEGFYELILEATDMVSENSIIREFIIDNTPPQVSFEPLEKFTFTQSFTLTMTGAAQDNFSGVEYVEYSIDSKNWFKTLITTGYKEKAAHFQLKHPFELEDGTYGIAFKTTDVSGNVSEVSGSQKIVVDTTPPRIGSYTLSAGTIILLAEEEFFEVLDGAKTELTISLERDTKKAILSVGTQEIELVKEMDLWKGEISLSGIGEYELLISAEDFLGNKVEKKEIGTLKLVNKGRVVSSINEPVRGAQLNISIFSKENQSWTRWQAESYGLQNPVSTDRDGKYELLLPPGMYQISIRRSGFKRLKTSSFNLLNPNFITFDFELEPRKGLRGFLENLLEKITF